MHEMYDAKFELYRVKNYDFTGAESWTILIRNMGLRLAWVKFIAILIIFLLAT